MALDQHALSVDVVSETLGVILKYQDDIAKIDIETAKQLLNRAENSVSNRWRRTLKSASHLDTTNDHHIRIALTLTFTLPTDIDTAFTYFMDLRRVIGFLPRIEFVTGVRRKFSCVCVLSVKELNAYDIKIYCDALDRN